MYTHVAGKDVANRRLSLIGSLIYRRDFEMLSQALFSVLLIAGCLVVYEVGIWKSPVKRPHSLK